MGMDIDILNAKLKGLPNLDDIANIFKRLTKAEQEIQELYK